MSDKKIALITGANKGLGFETAKQLANKGFTVLIGARDETRGKDAVDKLKAENLDAHFVHLDVNDLKTHETAAKFIEETFGKLDVLVNNAAIIVKGDGDGKPSETSLEIVRETFETNFFNTIAVTQTFLPLVKKSDAGRIVNVSSGLGSLTLHGDPNWEFYAVKPLAYNSSKTALNAFTVILAHELKDTKIKVNSADPGFTATDLNGNSGYKTVEQGASVITDLATLDENGASGSYFDDNGVLPW
ncbi:MAG: SDR family oxidoreductase [Pyrinomonadaceae bacterium]|nr:SDR family oxidoreductase [Pyrinomonadaceae bacterium]